jgi:hypothetical protein
MERTPINSSMIASIGYDPSNGTLEVEFKKGGVIWQYYDVPENVWHEFQSAASQGKYFLANIRNRFGGSKIG